MPTPDEHVDRLRRLYAGVWDGEDATVADELVAPDYVIHDRDVAEELRGPELYTTFAEMTREIFPDVTFAIEDVMTAGDRVALRWTMTGTHEGSMMGEEPTGKQVELTALEIDRFENGRLAETWTQSDVLGLMEQVGAVRASEKE